MLVAKTRISSSIIDDSPVYQAPEEDVAQRFDFGCWTLNVGSSVNTVCFLYALGKT